VRAIARPCHFEEYGDDDVRLMIEGVTRLLAEHGA